MKLFYPLNTAIALKYLYSSRTHRFAFFVSILSTIGIILGVAALIIDSSIMQGLENQLKKSVLLDTPHVVVQATSEDKEKLLKFDHVIAVGPFVESQTLLLASNLELINLQGIAVEEIIFKHGYSQEDLGFITFPQKDNFSLIADARVLLRNSLPLGSKVKLVSTINARYTPMGLTPTQRNFSIYSYFSSAGANSIENVIGHYEDVRRFFRMDKTPSHMRLWLDDPFNITEVAQELKSSGFSATDWRVREGEFFKAVSMEKLTMNIMLFLIVVVAAFNILSSLSMTVSSRLTDIAILKTLGLMNKDVLKIFIINGLIIGIIGTALGTLLGMLLLPHLATEAMLGDMPYDFKISNVVIIAIASLTMTLVSTCYPALKASTTDPVSNLNRG